MIINQWDYKILGNPGALRCHNILIKPTILHFQETSAVLFTETHIGHLHLNRAHYGVHLPELQNNPLLNSIN
jgi:hypothetical protein